MLINKVQNTERQSCIYRILKGILKIRVSQNFPIFPRFPPNIYPISTIKLLIEGAPPDSPLDTPSLRTLPEFGTRAKLKISFKRLYLQKRFLFYYLLERVE